jgi:predicted DNA-binding transcriptional regulator AlpA
LAALLGVSRSTLYAGLATGRYPKNDGYDGKLDFPQ